jgi:hypothetical protein
VSLARWTTAAALCALAAAASGCNFTRRSGDYACDGPEDCSDDRVCDNGWCIEFLGDIDASLADADPFAPDAQLFDSGPFVCPAECMTPPGAGCDADEYCLFNCGSADSCASLTCPPGAKCKITCTGQNSCATALDCSAAQSCWIECSDNTCAGAITCPEGRCRVECAATACTGGIDCSQSCMCDTFCLKSGGCTPAPMCPHTDSPPCIQGTECTSIGGQCNSC